MKKNQKLLIGMVTSALLLSACGNSTADSSSAAEENQSQGENQSQEQSTSNEKAGDANLSASNSTSANESSTKAEESETNEEQAEAETKEETSSENEESLKEEYLEKLNQATKELEEKKNNLEDDSTYAMKNMEGERFDVLDGLLNEIYGVLEKQLPAEEMEALRQEQREWIDYRDKTAKKASLKYEGGTMEQLEYVAVENDLTEKRCYELVKNYMK
ncbi:lysozyme inhibitor LprI family protein [Bacillus sp. RAR_GA_16]|uniref:lysozyme inhibitor LprI family protein n=1 Tax=Bacillus sp. RAR_GA_16 TaxID=2876774 RepID=UPI001CCD73D0|nr:lysozyme inhibitor LprI family protein [Bacillus sp. RAR_GA_16]MCA0173983.1 lysozyme inhibitor LprI family protein [Bacillus sp. RAR_GA_16]